jgi:hypothetical protein
MAELEVDGGEQCPSADPRARSALPRRQSQPQSETYLILKDWWRLSPSTIFVVDLGWIIELQAAKEQPKSRPRQF